MTTVEPLEQLQPVEARTIIEHLRRGSVPVEQVPCFTVGRERWLSIIEDDLAHYIAAGGTKVRFLNGDYGDGKTHFLSIIQHLAAQAGFAVSFVVLTREVPMQKFELVYREIASKLATASGARGLRGLITHWLDTLQPHLGEAPDEATRAARVEALAETLGAWRVWT
jgi:bacteriophage exclusion system BrxC/D-like protein